MVLKFHQSCGLSIGLGQALLDMHPEHDIKDVQSTTIVQLSCVLSGPLRNVL